MNFKELFSDAVRTLWTHKLRTALTMFGIAWGIFSITLMVGATQGLRIGLQRNSASFGKDIMIVFAGTTSMHAGGMRAGRRVHWDENDYKFVGQQSPSCKYVMPELGNNVPLRSSYNSGDLLTTGSLPPFAEYRTINVAEGRFYSNADVDNANRVAFIGSDSKKQLFGGRLALGEKIWLADIPYTVIGVMKTKDQNSDYDGRDIRKVFIPYTAMIRDFPNRPPAPPHTIDRLLVVPQSLTLHEDCKRQVRLALGTLHHFNPDDKEAAGIWDTIEDAKANMLIMDGMQYFMWAVGIITLCLGGLSVMNVMLVAVRERTNEIGIRKAIGATRRAILGQFFIETLIIAFISGGVGMGLAFGLCALVNLLPMPQVFAGLIPTWQSSLFSVVMLSLIALLSAMYPARRAAAVDPIEALRWEAGG
jgi:putative ABC transport system permease protein